MRRQVPSEMTLMFCRGQKEEDDIEIDVSMINLRTNVIDASTKGPYLVRRKKIFVIDQRAGHISFRWSSNVIR